MSLFARRMHYLRSSTNDYSVSFNPLAGNRSGLRLQTLRLQHIRWLHLSVAQCLTSFACPLPTTPSADFCTAIEKDRSSPSQFLSLARSQGSSADLPG